MSYFENLIVCSYIEKLIQIFVCSSTDVCIQKLVFIC